MNRSERAIFKVLEGHYSAEKGYALIPQVRNGTGHARVTVRTADAICMQLYPSRGLELHGFEFKASRADWRNELKNPEKAEDVAAYCHRWSVVAPDGVVPLDELPPAWGLIQVVDGAKLKFSRHAPRQEIVEPLDLLFLAAVLRRVQRENTTPEALQNEYLRGIEEGRRRAGEAEDGWEKRCAAAEERIRTFEEASGVRIDRWQAERIGHAVRLVLDGDARHEIVRLERLAEQAERIAPTIRQAIARAQAEVA